MSSGRRAVALGLFFLTTVLPAIAETTEVLATGPDRGKGIPYLSANVIEYYLVTYRPESSSMTANTAPAVKVYYTQSEIVPYASWKPLSCRGHRLLSVSVHPDVVYYRDRQGWSLFIAFPAGSPDTCSFGDAFIAQFIYFLGITGNTPLSSFPAILKLP